MTLTIMPGKLSGTVAAIPSKSAAHRLLICAALAKEETTLLCGGGSEDINATARCMQALGADICRTAEGFTVRPGQTPEKVLLDCGESGSTLRFLLPVIGALGVSACVKMHGRLPQRPLEPLWSLLQEHGITAEKPEPDLLSLSGKLSGQEFTIAADVSSQYISGLLFALPLLGGGQLLLTGKTESAGYISMTIDALRAFGIAVRWEGNRITVGTGPYRSPGKASVEGDWSNGAFWLTAAALGCPVSCTGLPEETSQGDREILACLQKISTGKAVLDAAQIPDLVPILAVAAALTCGETEIRNAGRLRLKESDRLQTVSDMIAALGGDITQTSDALFRG